MSHGHRDAVCAEESGAEGRTLREHVAFFGCSKGLFSELTEGRGVILGPVRNLLESASSCVTFEDAYPQPHHRNQTKAPC